MYGKQFLLHDSSEQNISCEQNLNDLKINTNEILNLMIKYERRYENGTFYFEPTQSSQV